MNLPSSLQPIPVPMPPLLPEALDFPKGSRFVSLTYEATDCYVTDGSSGHSDSYWVYAALINHFAIAIHLIGCDLGSDDTFPTHALLVDVEEAKLYVGPYDAVRAFLRDRQDTTNPLPQLTPEQQQELWHKLVAAVDEQQALVQQQIQSGEFERLVQQRMVAEQQHIAQIRQFLDGYTTSALALVPEIRNAALQTNNRAAIAWLEILTAEQARPEEAPEERREEP